ncbi:MAG TPA: heparan-alpha-glucosaminide N-acetyltransferase domain-containing protein [Jiangellales bacterium]|nr:heparan-alpha-glucosaminide N-acetyltransferase domain-containing protein [Jiangellales bacterium]
MTEVKVHSLPSDDDGIQFFAVARPVAPEVDRRAADGRADSQSDSQSDSESDPAGSVAQAPGPRLTAETSGAITWYSLPEPAVTVAEPDVAIPAGGVDVPAPPVAEIAHACEPEFVLARSAPTAGQPEPESRRRLVGVDMARGIALLGMMAVHIVSSETAAGTMSTAWALAAGKSAALFAVLAGVGIAFTTGGTQVLHGRRRTAAAAALAVRAMLIGCLGLLLGSLVPIDTAGVILAYYAVLFLLAIPLLGLSVRTLVVLTALTAVAIPVASHMVRGAMTAPELGNPTFADLVGAPGDLVAELTLTGLYPALPWIAYVCAGLAIGRSRLTARGFVMGMTAAGVALACVSSAASWAMMERLGGRAQLADVAMRSMPLDEYTGLLVWGADGTLPTTSAWWLTVLAPHTTTPVDILYTIGVAIAVIGACIIVGWVTRSVLRPLAAAGSMPLTLYTLHLLLLVAPFTPDREGTSFLLQVGTLLTFATLWGRRFDRGPLEQVVWRVTGNVRSQILDRGEAAGGRRPAR